MFTTGFKKDVPCQTEKLLFCSYFSNMDNIGYPWVCIFAMLKDVNWKDNAVFLP